MKRKTSLDCSMLIALVLGLLFGLLARGLFPTGFNGILMKWILAPVGDMFYRAVKAVIVPLVTCSLICSAVGIGDIRKLGRTGGKAAAYYLAAAAVAVTGALIFANLTNPGMGLNLALPVEHDAAGLPCTTDSLVKVIPINPIESLANGEMLQIIVFTAVFGAAISLAGKSVNPLLSLIRQVNDVMLIIADLVLQLAPYGVFSLISGFIITGGIGAMLPLLKYAITMLLALLLQVLIIYGSALKLLGKVNPICFYKKYWPVMLAAFSTSSSYAAIPMSLKACQKKLGVSKYISSFTIPLGAAANMDGTAILTGVASIFLVQLFGIDLSIAEQLSIIALAVLASIGTAGIPGGDILALSMVLTQAGIPAAGIPLILSADAGLAMCRAAVNAAGNAAIAVIISSSEKELDLDIFNS